MTELTIPQIEEIAARAANSFKGAKVMHQNNTADARSECWIKFGPGYESGLLNPRDAEFFVAARTDVPALCSTALSAIRERDAYKAAIEKEAHGINCRSRKLLPFGRKARAEFDSSCDCWKARIA